MRRSTSQQQHKSKLLVYLIEMISKNSSNMLLLHIELF